MTGTTTGPDPVTGSRSGAVVGGTTAMTQDDHRDRLRRRRARLAVGFILVVGIYLMGTFLNPRVVPRLSFLPEPASRGEWFESCNGAPGNRHTETWESTGLFWSRTEFHTLAGCIDQPVPN